jgi:hypothetical protein
MAYDPAELVDPLTLPEFQPIIAALQRGTRRGQLRLLEIICRRNHQLGEVFGTLRAPVLLINVRDGVGAAVLTHLAPDAETPVQCRCQTSAIPVDWITKALRGPDKRRIWPPPNRFVGVGGKTIACYGPLRPTDTTGML